MASKAIGGHDYSVIGIQPEPESDLKRAGRGPSIQLVPTAIMVAIMAALAVFYFGVREVRVEGPSDTRQAQSTEDSGSWTFTVPRSWIDQEQQNVAKSSGRWWSGPTSSDRTDGLFVTAYRLSRTPKGSKDSRLRREALASLKRTGAPKTLRKFEDVKVAGLDGWKFEYDARPLRVSTSIVVDPKARKMFQISCQAASAEVLAACEDAVASASR